MSTAAGKARAKINLSLDVTGRRPDGYHEMRMVMQSVTLADDVLVDITPGTGAVRAETAAKYVPSDLRNVACKAAAVYFTAAGITDADAVIRIEKRIPVCAGMGGGSADAAAVLRLLNGMFCAFSGEKLRELGAGVGSDVPFCLFGGTALAQGRGEVLTRLPPLPECGLVICKPPFPSSTPKLFSRLDEKEIRVRPDTDGLIAALEAGDLAGAASRCGDVFEGVLAPSAAAQIAAAKASLLALGALGASMTGTGSAVFGVFPDGAAARRAFGALRRKYRECFLAGPSREEN